MRSVTFPVWAQWSVAALAALAAAFGAREGGVDLVAYPLFGLALLFALFAVWNLPLVERARASRKRHRTEEERSRERDRLTDECALEFFRFDGFYLAGRTFTSYYYAAEDVGASLEQHREGLEGYLDAATEAGQRLLTDDRDGCVKQLLRVRSALEAAETIESMRLLSEVQEFRTAYLEPMRRYYRSERSKCGLEEPDYEIPTLQIDRPLPKSGW